MGKAIHLPLECTDTTEQVSESVKADVGTSADVVDWILGE
jgi:hypothetical protein